MGCPMLPVPMKPICSDMSVSSCLQSRRFGEKTLPYRTLLANASNTGMVQCKEKVVKESTGKEESHVDVCTRVGNHSRGDGACGRCGREMHWENCIRTSSLRRSIQ